MTLLILIVGAIGAVLFAAACVAEDRTGATAARLPPDTWRAAVHHLTDQPTDYLGRHRA